MKTQYLLRHYLTEDGSDLVIEWLRALNDRQAVSRVLRFLDMMRSGNFGENKEGVWELRVNYGPGYRIYCCFDGDVIVLLSAGDGRKAQPGDMKTAGKYKVDYERGRQKRSRPHDAAIEELLHQDPELSAEYINQALREGAQSEMLFAMRRVVRAHGGVTKLAAMTGLSEKAFSNALSAKGDPRLSNFLAICDAIGMRVSITAESPSANS